MASFAAAQGRGRPPRQMEVYPVWLFKLPVVSVGDEEEGHGHPDVCTVVLGPKKGGKVSRAFHSGSRLFFFYLGFLLRLYPPVVIPSSRPHPPPPPLPPPEEEEP